MVYTDPDGESFVAFAIGFVIGAYLGGAAANDWDFTPWNGGNGSWDFNSIDTWSNMIFWGLAGGFGASMGWSVLAENYAFNITVGSGIGESLQAGAQFLVSNSGIAFEGLGYTTAAGGGAFLTYEAIKGMNSKDMDYGKTGTISLIPNTNSDNPYVVFDVHNTGASMYIIYNYSSGNYNWYQTVSSNQRPGSNSLSEYFTIDNGGSLSSPWYPPEFIHKGRNSQIILYDTPNRHSLIPGMYWEAESSLFSYRDNYYSHVTTVRWGFYNSEGKAKGYYRTNVEPSAQHKNALLQWIRSVIW